MNTLQTLVFPNLEVCTEEALYLRLNSSAWLQLSPPRLTFLAGGLVWSDTFYNGLTVTAWKRDCDIRSLVLALEGEGDFIITFGLHRRGQATIWLSEQVVRLLPGHRAHVPVRAWEGLADGMLFFRLRATGAASLDRALYLTADEPANDVRLGLVITHFNRQAQVLPAIERIRQSVHARPDLQGRITLTVVDNSRNLPLTPQPGLQRIPNRNLGGTGGFVRGLLELMRDGSTTHALFMDDDASCEPESIARTFALLQHSRDPRLSVAGALLREMAPWHLLEKGARFDGQVRPLCSGLDVRRIEDLLEAEHDRDRSEYGAWWFFAFPLSEVRRFPFPFFVRGDDIFFGLSNRFRTTTLNGIACFGEDFSAKHGPLTAYLDARYHVVLALLGERRAKSRIMWVASRLFLKPLTSYQYTSARAVTLALRHTLEGPEFFRKNLDLASVRAEIATWLPSEKLLPRADSPADLRGPRRRRETKLRRLVRTLTLQGFLLPSALLINRTMVQNKAFHGRASDVFRYRRVLYEHAPTRTGYVAEYDRGRFFGELGAFLRIWLTLMVRLPQLRRLFASGAAELTSRAFWEGVYETASVTPPESAPPDRPAGRRAAEDADPVGHAAPSSRKVPDGVASAGP